MFVGFPELLGPFLLRDSSLKPLACDHTCGDLTDFFFVCGLPKLLLKSCCSLPPKETSSFGRTEAEILSPKGILQIKQSPICPVRSKASRKVKLCRKSMCCAPRWKHAPIFQAYLLTPLSHILGANPLARAEIQKEGGDSEHKPQPLRARGGRYRKPQVEGSPMAERQPQRRDL